VAEELDGEDPGLKLTVLGADEDASLSGDSEWLDGLRGANDGQIGLGQWEGGDGREGLSLCGKRGEGDEEREDRTELTRRLHGRKFSLLSWFVHLPVAGILRFVWVLATGAAGRQSKRRG